MSDERFNKLEEKVDKLDTRLDSIDKTLAVNTTHLEVHIEGVKQTRVLIQQNKDEFNARLRPLEKKQNIIDAIGKIVTFIGGVAVFGYSVVQILSFFKK